MQDEFVQYFIFEFKSEGIGEMHKPGRKRQMFLLHNHALLFVANLNKIRRYDGYILRKLAAFSERT